VEILWIRRLCINDNGRWEDRRMGRKKAMP
jgi:hypothetical protein